MRDSTRKLIWEKYVPLLVTTMIVIAGWIFGDWLAARRDEANKQRDVRIEYLVSAYSRLTNATQRKREPGSQYFRDMETATADIQLFGDNQQIANVRKFMDECQSKEYGSLNVLLTGLRDDLRQEMGLSEVEGDVQWFRPEGIPMSGQAVSKR